MDFLLLGDYIHLYQQQREQLQQRYQQKDLYIQQLTDDQSKLQVQLNIFFFFNQYEEKLYSSDVNLEKII